MCIKVKGDDGEINEIIIKAEHTKKKGKPKGKGKKKKAKTTEEEGSESAEKSDEGEQTLEMLKNVVGEIQPQE